VEKFKLENLTEKEVQLITDYRGGFRGVYWHPDDFEQRAREKEGNDYKIFYDESKFPEALERMMMKHDANYGINWVTVDFWLEEICARFDLDIVSNKVYYEFGCPNCSNYEDLPLDEEMSRLTSFSIIKQAQDGVTHLIECHECNKQFYGKILK